MWKPTFSHGAGLGTIRTTDYKDYKLQKISGQRKGRREGKGRKEGQEGREKERGWTHKVIL